MLETWLDEKGWKRVRERLPEGYEWGRQLARRKNKKGRAMEGMIMGIRRELIERGTRIETEKEGTVVGRVERSSERWRIVGVYVKKEDMGERLKDLEHWMEEKEEGIRTIIGGDFNARIGEREGGVLGDEGGNEWGKGIGGRRSKDKKIDKEGRMLVELIEEKGWKVFNGSMEGDEEGEYTFIGGKGNTVIDFVIGDVEVEEKIKKLKVEDRDRLRPPTGGGGNKRKG